MTSMVGRAVGMLAVVSGLSGLFVLVLQIGQRAQDTREQYWALALFNLLLIPAATYLWRSLGPSALLTVATACGVGSLILWAYHLILNPVGSLESLWLWTAAIWWLVLGTALRHVGRRIGVFTFVVGLAALLDAIVSTPALNPPFLVFALLGLWKIPLSFAWALVIGVWMIRSPVTLRTKVA